MITTTVLKILKSITYAPKNAFIKFHKRDKSKTSAWFEPGPTDY